MAKIKRIIQVKDGRSIVLSPETRKFDGKTYGLSEICSGRNAMLDITQELRKKPWIKSVKTIRLGMPTRYYYEIYTR